MAGRVGIAVKDIEKSKEQLRDELKILRAQAAELKTSILENSHEKSLERGADACSSMPEERPQRAMRLEALSILAGGVAHDFNNLLMGIQGNVSLMYLNTGPDHPNYKRLRSIEENIESGAEIARQILGFARGGKYYFKPVNLNEIVKKTAIMFGSARREIRIKHECQKNLYPVMADQTQIEQVFLSLFTNSWEAMPDGGEIYIKTGNITLDNKTSGQFEPAPGRYARVSVQDTGTGMDEDVRQRVFDPYFTTKERGRGTGLGLAATFGIIKGHGGNIAVESEKGQGTAFVFYLPALEQ
jgi:signal transduction histidine kinase